MLKIRLRWFAFFVAPVALVLATTNAASAQPGAALDLDRVAVAATAASAAPGLNSAAPSSVAGDSTTITPQAIGDCPATYLCVWVNINYSLGPARFAGNNDHWSAFHSDACQVKSWNDCASSGFNNGTSGLGVEVWRDTYYKGAPACLPKGWHHPDFTKLVWPGTSFTFNDSISSNKWTDLC